MDEGEPDVESRIYRVEGRVQGVGFRWWTRKMAQELGLVGRVRNERDGTVKVRVRGRTKVLDQLEKALWRGPQLAEVRTVRRGEAEDAAAEPWEAFEIERG